MYNDIFQKIWEKEEFLLEALCTTKYNPRGTSSAGIYCRRPFVVTELKSRCTS